MALILQQKVTGRETTQAVDGKSVTVKRTAAIILDEESGETHIIPWDKRTDKPILSIDLLKQLDPDITTGTRRALRKSPRRRVKR